MESRFGIVGLPNVGKSTLFNALTNSHKANAANYPFCTIEPNVGIVAVPDFRLDKLAEVAGSKKIIPAQIEFVDIAGLVKGASKGEGLGNKFLSHIREVDAIVYMLRCFEDDDITHVEGNVDPIRDSEIIETELILSDIESLTKQLKNVEKKVKQDKLYAQQVELIGDILKVLNSGSPARLLVNDSNSQEIKKLNLLTSKPFFYICNVEEENVVNGNKFTELVKNKAAQQNSVSINISAKIEEEIANLDDEIDRREFLKEIGLEESGLNRAIKVGYKILNLNTYFTIGPKEAHAWTYKTGTTAQKAAGIIHTDFEKGFICAETISYDDYVKFNGEQGAKEVGKLRQEGREYIVQDGDIMLFRFNVSNNQK
ncbi:redox-regulated ATPase YchF [Candidatus Bandiella euplotis]|uniref:Ribosome-binding ATPase YchF n=1 Tax=Candidatus Bandiella euplotis TaxID=1664265 RepID=A0ABZ0UL61_9RICK|nr:redox-regulated ATPase YchF [Candidatus Bandiella woodruffii]WPX96227.1 Redox-regulated ATPase YchF [Candidatus Bandiella woodruffii]